MLFLCSIFYLIYPFLVWVTPPGVFDELFGLVHVNPVTAFAVWPIALGFFLLWLKVGPKRWANSLLTVARPTKRPARAAGAGWPRRAGDGRHPGRRAAPDRA